MTSAVVDRIRALPRAERLALYRELEPGTLGSQLVAPAFWARENQALPEPGDLSKIELVVGGRGAGKTQWAVWLLLREWISGRAKRVRVITATERDAHKTMMVGASGLWTWLPHEFKSRANHDVDRAFVRSTGGGGTFTIPGLPPIDFISAMKPGSATGEGKDLTLADDPAKWSKVCGEARSREMFREARVSTREGRNPCVIVATTDDGVPFLRRALAGNMAGVRKRNLGSAQDNTALSEGYKADVIEDMIGEGDDDGLTGVERLDTPGALWKHRWIAHVPTKPELTTVVVSIDPADDGKNDSDETGIVVVGLGEDRRLYVLADYTARWRAEQWAAIAAWALRRHGASTIVAEGNRAWSAVKHALNVAAPGVPVERVDAGESKEQRARPIALLYSEGLVSHLTSGPQLSRPGHVQIAVSIFNPETDTREEIELEVRRDPRGWITLEEELCGWVPRQSRSPNGLDALVWACWHMRPPEGEGYAQLSRFAGIGAVEGRYHDEDARNVGVGGASNRNADPRWER